jgi:hypothetical protein
MAMPYPFKPNWSFDLKISNRTGLLPIIPGLEQRSPANLGLNWDGKKVRYAYA